MYFNRRVVSDLQKSSLFYEMLGFSRIHRPSSLRCDGVWLYGFSGLGIHLIKGKPVAREPVIDPQADHISFQVREGKLGILSHGCRVLKYTVLYASAPRQVSQ